MGIEKWGAVLIATGLIVAAAPARAESDKRIAILEFRGPGSQWCGSEDPPPGRNAELCPMLSALADAVREAALAAIQESGLASRFSVITRENVEIIRKQNGSQVCSEGECEIETGRLVGADLVVTGEVTVLDGAYHAVVKVHETTNGKLLRSQATDRQLQLELVRETRALSQTLLRDSLPVVLGTGAPSELVFGYAVQINVPQIRVDPGASTSKGVFNINLQAEGLLDKALEVEARPNAYPEAKAAAWCAVAAFKDDNPYAVTAFDGCAAWMRYASQYWAQLSAMTIDYQTLGAYFALKRKPDAQKLAAAAAFLGAYHTLKKEELYQRVEAAQRDLAAGRRVELPDALEGLEKSCSGEERGACVLLAAAHEQGAWPLRGKDESRARALRELACEAGIAFACQQAAAMLQKANPESPRARTLLERGCSVHDASCCRGLGSYLRQTATPNLMLARAKASEACELGDLEGCADAGRALLEEKLGATEDKQAAAFLQRSCDGGVLRACYSLGQLCEQKRATVDQCPARQYRVACEGNVAAACARLALLDLAGAPLLKQHRSPEQVALLEKACAAKDADGCRFLAQYHVGFGSRERALALLEQNCSAEDARSCTAFAAARSESHQPEYDPTLALQLYQKGCKLGDGAACEPARRLGEQHAAVGRAAAWRATGWVSVTIGGLSLAGAGVVGILGRIENRKLTRGGLATASDIATSLDYVEKLDQMTWILGGSGAGLAGLGALLILLNPEPEFSPTPLVRLGVEPSADGARLCLRGVF